MSARFTLTLHKHLRLIQWLHHACVMFRGEIATANDEWHKVREEKLRANNLAQQRSSLEARITDLESECSSLQQQVQQDSAKREPLDAKKRQYLR